MTVMVERSFTDLLEEIVDNRGRTCPTADSGLPLIATNCIKDDHLYPVFENVRYVDTDTLGTWFRGHPLPDDIIFVCKGSPGRVAMVPDPVPFCIAQDMVALRADRRQVEPRYLYYALKSPAVQAKINNMHVGSMIPHFKKGDFGKLRFSIHEDIGEQQAIAEVLGTLDDKITANNQLAGTAERLAAAQYQRHIRHLPFSERTFGDTAKVSGGGTPSTSVPGFWNGDVLWATPTDVTGLQGPYLSSTSRRISEAGLNACASELYPAGAILMTSRATIGAFALAQEPMAVNQGFIVVQPNDPDLRFWFFHEMQSRVDEFVSLANGATFLELSRGNFKKFKVRLAETQAMKQFVALAEPLHAVAANALSENTKLAATRDTLLPRLMSGKHRVKDAEKVLEKAGV